MVTAIYPLAMTLTPDNSRAYSADFSVIYVEIFFYTITYNVFYLLEFYDKLYDFSNVRN